MCPKMKVALAEGQKGEEASEQEPHLYKLTHVTIGIDEEKQFLLIHRVKHGPIEPTTKD